MSSLKYLSKFLGKCSKITFSLIKYGCIIHCTFEYVGYPVICQGLSMEPTLHSDDILLVEQITTHLNKIKRGDVVIVQSPSDPHKHICKRVSALGGDRVRKGVFNVTIPRGHVYVLGDNAGDSTDSRIFGPLPQGLIRGRAVWRLWPYSKFGAIE